MSDHDEVDPNVDFLSHLPAGKAKRFIKLLIRILEDGDDDD